MGELQIDRLRHGGAGLFSHNGKKPSAGLLAAKEHRPARRRRSGLASSRILPGRLTSRKSKRGGLQRGGLRIFVFAGAAILAVHRLPAPADDAVKIGDAAQRKPR
jgi:hypothetical protein